MEPDVISSTIAAPATVGTRVSSELFVIPLQTDRYLIYAPLRQAAFVGNASVVNFIADAQENRSEALANSENRALLELLQRLQMLDAGPEAQPIHAYAGTPRPTAITLFMTTACNLRCTYCYASAGDLPLETMALETAKRGIRYVANNARDLGRAEFEIAYHGGGEPTANWPVMVESLAYARELGREYGLGVRAAAASNGVLSQSQVDWIIANLDGVSLSFDGLPQAHDTHRLTIVGQGSSHLVMKTMQRFDAAGFRYGVRLTVTRDQIALLPASVEFVCTRFKPTRIQVEPAYQLGRWKDAPSAETEEFIAAYRQARSLALDLGSDITYSAARVGLLTNHFCGVTQDSFALSPSGNVSGCYEVFSENNKHADTFFYGQPGAGAEEYVFDQGKLGHLRDQAVEHREFCRGCFAKWHCAGDCYHKAITVSGSTEFEGSDRCHITRELTKDQILERIARSGGLFWHEPTVDHCAHRAAGKELLP